MKKLLFTFLAALCCTVMALAANSNATKIEYEPGKFMYFILDKTNTTNPTATVTWGGDNLNSGTTEYAGSITIPSTVSDGSKDYTVTSVGDNAFSKCTMMTSVTIPEGVTSIGDDAFINCGSLISVTIPEGVTSIGKYAFDNCLSMTSVIIPSTVTSIEYWAFYACEKLTLMFQGDIPEHLNSDIFGNIYFRNYYTYPTIVVYNKYKDNYTGFFGNEGGKQGPTIVSLSEFKTQVQNEIKEALKNAIDLTELTEQDMATKEIKANIERRCSDIESATTPADVLPIKEIALLTISLIPNMQAAITELNNLVKDKVGLDIRRYITAICNATSEEQIAEILNNAKDPKTFTVVDKTYYLNIGPDYTFYGDITFNDKDSYQSGNDFTVDGKLEYSRTFAATGVWQAWFVPFDVPVGIMNAAGMEVAEIAGVLMDGEVPYIAFAKMTDPYAIVNANTPYVVKATKSSVSMTLTGPDICIRKSTSAELEAQRLTVQSSFDTFTFGGNYQQTNGYANEWYALNTNGIFQKMGKDVYLAPQRFWMTIDTRTDTPYYTGSSATAKAFINFTVLGDDSTTGIERLTPTLSESKGTIYNLQGQRVTNIQKGQVYIMNGKKFFAR